MLCLVRNVNDYHGMVLLIYLYTNLHRPTLPAVLYHESAGCPINLDAMTMNKDLFDIL